MKEKFVLMVCLLWCAFVHGQSTDSLLKALPTAKDDTTRVNILWALADNYLESNLDTTLHLSEQALLLARKNDYLPGEGRVLYTMGKVFKQKGNYPKALELYLKSKAIHEAIHEPMWLASNYFSIGEIYEYQDNYHQAFAYYTEAEEIYQKQRNGYGAANVYLKMGIAFEKHGMPDSAFYYIRKIDSIQYNRKDIVENLEGKIWNELGNIYAQQGNAALAMSYYRQSYAQLLATNSDRPLCQVLLNMARQFQKDGSNDSCLYYAKQSLAIARQGGFLLEVLGAADFLAQYYKSHRRFDSAFQYMETGVHVKDSLFSREKLMAIQGQMYDDQLHKQELTAQQLRIQSQVKIFGLLGLSLVLLVLAFVFWRNNKHKQKANVLLQQQKQEVQNTLSELKAVQQQLIHAEKMASLGEVTAGIAHEIQNPLNFITNFSDVGNELLTEAKEVLRNGNVAEAMTVMDDLGQNLQKINQHGRRADAIVKNMLEHSRKNTGIKESTDINGIVDEYLTLCYQAIRTKDKTFNAVIEKNFDHALGRMNIIPQDMGRVLVNLFNNAFYSVSEKRKQLSNGYQPTLQVSTHRGEDNFEIRVRDNGLGIPEKVVDKIYQPFFTTKPTGDGTGLGLSLSYDIVTKVHGGSLKVNTRDKEFAEFVIVLPAN